MNTLSHTLSEDVDYDFVDFPAYVRHSFLSYYPNYSALSHWHNDVEFVCLLDGKMKYNINGKIVSLEKGECIFVNSKQLHYGFSDTKEECEFVCVLLHPLLLCSTTSLEKKYVTPLISNSAFEYCVLNSKTPWQKSVIDSITALCMNKNNCPELFIQTEFFKIWTALYENMPKEKTTHTDTSSDMTAVKNMLKFIHENYSEKISLDDISSYGNICKNKCCQLFKGYLDKSPIGYLICYRLEKSIELLKDTDRNITEIAFDVGFSGTSYFVETFRKHYGCSPNVYRKNLS